MARTVGLSQKKMVFPYGVLTDSGPCLLAEGLPRDRDSWFDVLSQSYPSEEDVSRAHADYESLGCTTLGSYLREYLLVDLRLLVRSAHRLLDTFSQLTGVSPVECERATLSSYAMFCSQSQLAADLRPAGFCNNNPVLYNLLRHSLRGGLTLVSRASVCAGETEALNEPVLGPLEPGNLPVSLLYLDVSGLYSAAGAYLLFIFILF